METTYTLLGFYHDDKYAKDPLLKGRGYVKPNTS